MMETPQLYARLDKSRERVLCAVIDCGTEIGQVVLERWVFPGPQIRVLHLAPGWHFTKDRIWRYRPGGEHSRPRRRPVGYQTPNTQITQVPGPFPCLAECPGCHRVLVLDQTRLDIPLWSTRNGPDLVLSTQNTRF